MENDYYPWGGEYIIGNPQSPVAVVTLAEEPPLPLDKVAIHGRMKTENLGIEKVVANSISNPHIRYLIIFGEEIRGHKAGGSLIALYDNGLDESRRIKGAPGAVPYIENIDDDAIARFRDQLEIVNLLNNTDLSLLMRTVDSCLEKNPGSYGEPYIAIHFQKEATGATGIGDTLALHNSILVSPFLELTTLEKGSDGLHLHAKISMDYYGRVRSA